MKFEEVRPKIVAKLKDLEKGVGEELILINGFVNQSLAEAEGEVVIGGTVIPMVVAIGKDSGKIHFFSAKRLGIK